MKVFAMMKALRKPLVLRACMVSTLVGGKILLPSTQYVSELLPPLTDEVMTATMPAVFEAVDVPVEIFIL